MNNEQHQRTLYRLAVATIEEVGEVLSREDLSSSIQVDQIRQLLVFYEDNVDDVERGEIPEFIKKKL